MTLTDCQQCGKPSPFLVAQSNKFEYVVRIYLDHATNRDLQLIELMFDAECQKFRKLHLFEGSHME